MTEYDYSPEAYERHIAKQNAIARWVDHTNHCAPTNPFQPSEAQDSPHPRRLTCRGAHDSESEGDHYQHSSSSHHRHHGDDRDHHRRPHYDRYDSHQSHSSSRKNSRSSSSPPTRSNSYYPHRQSSQDRAGYFYSSPGPHTPNPYGSSSSTPLTPPQPRTPYEQPSGNQPTLVPIHGGAGGYYLVPPQGVSYQVMVSVLKSPFAFLCRANPSLYL
jgi:hypothetical protein